MRICVFGLGHVGCVYVGCLARAGHTVVGVDVDAHKTARLGEGCATIIEPGVDDLIRTGWEAGHIRATTDSLEGMRECDLSVICVETPGQSSGGLDLQRVFEVAEAIASGLAHATPYHVIVIRSTVIPGTNRRVGALIEQRSGKRRGTDFEVVNVPEFQREGSALADFDQAPLMVAGTDSERAFQIVSGLFGEAGPPLQRASIEATELLKMVNNAWHALKVVFANEVGAVCKSLGIDSHEVMGLFRQDTKLNLSGCYLQPGFAYGGSCLPKDLGALAALGRAQGLAVPVIESIERSNTLLKERVVRQVVSHGAACVGIVGLSFKPGTDDVRSSPMLDVAEGIAARGLELRIYDHALRASMLDEGTRAYLERRLPRLGECLVDDPAALFPACGLILAAARDPALAPLLQQHPDVYIIDLVRLGGPWERHPGGYNGIAW